MESPADTLLDTRATAKYLNVSPKTLDRWRSKRLYLPFTRLGDRPNAPVRYRRGELDKYLQRQTVAVSETWGGADEGEAA